MVIKQKNSLLEAPNDEDVSFYSIDADDDGSHASKDGAGAVKLIVFDVENVSGIVLLPSVYYEYIYEKHYKCLQKLSFARWNSSCRR